MKKLIVILYLFIASFVNAEAPGPPAGIFGVRFMPVFTSFNFRTVDNNEVKGDLTLGLGYGAVVGMYLTNHFGLQVEGIYNDLSQKYKDGYLERTIHVNYINVPLLLCLNTGYLSPVSFNVVAGPQ